MKPTRAAPVLVCLLTSGLARADDAASTVAQALFDEARQLTAAGRYVEACPKFAESQRIDPSMGTRFYLADCLEHIGKLAPKTSSCGVTGSWWAKRSGARQFPSIPGIM
jgi:hypothetical protein